MTRQLTLTLDPNTPCQRWRNGHTRFRPAGETIDRTRYGIEMVSEKVARAFIAKHHYAQTMPPARRSFGLIETNGHGRHRLVGVCVFSVPMNNSAIPKYTGQPAAAGVELGRFVLEDAVPGNGESFFLSLAFRALRLELPEVRSVISYSDPVPRILANGETQKRGHFGICYKATGGFYCGRGSRRTLIFARNGQVLSDRTLSKLRNHERGADGAYRQMLALGAPPRRLGEANDTYIRRAVSEGPFIIARHAGNHCYAWAMGTRRERKSIEAGFAPRLPYPVAADAPLHLVAA